MKNEEWPLLSATKRIIRRLHGLLLTEHNQLILLIPLIRGQKKPSSVARKSYPQITQITRITFNRAQTNNPLNPTNPRTKATFERSEKILSTDYADYTDYFSQSIN